MKITKKFKQLTKYTYPHGTERDLIHLLPLGYKSDGLGNYYLQIGDSPSTLFSCHLDTVGAKKQLVTHVHVKANYIETDGKTILGADDKAGMTVMLYMIENKVPGLYYFFIGEERGCVGSGLLSRKWKNTEFSKYIKKIVSFDRKGTSSIITKQFFERTCSDDFANDLAKRLNDTGYGFKFKPDPTGLFTDSAEFSNLVPECTNVSVGYYNEHTTQEFQDIDFLIKLCKAVCEIDWETLTIKRDHTVSEKFYDFEDDSDYDYDYNDYGFTWSGDNYSHFTSDEPDGKPVKMYISDQKIEEETKMLFEWLKNTGSYPGISDITWNGNTLYALTDSYDYVGTRYDISKLLPELAVTPLKHLKKMPMTRMIL